MRMRTDIIQSVLFILVGIGVVVESVRLKLGTPLAPQPGFFPFLGGLLLIGLSLIFLTQEWLRHGRTAPPPQEGFGEWRRPLILVAGIGAYTAVLEWLGYIVPTVLLTAAILRILGVTSRKKLALASLGLSIGTYYLFARLLGIELPAGILPFLA